MQFWCIAAAVLNLQARETRWVFVTSLRQIVADEDGVRKVQWTKQTRLFAIWT